MITLDDVDNLDAIAIIQQMDADGWHFLATNSVQEDSKIAYRPGEGFCCIFGKRTSFSYRGEMGGAGTDFTQAVRDGAKKALRREW